MAEFTEVMRQARRLCEEQQNIDFCVRCPMQGKDGCMVVADAENIDYVEVERKIMDWAKEHPEPVYPSWEEGWRQLFPDAKYTPCPNIFGHKYMVRDCKYLICTDCKSNPMPAEIAEKLGIKPIAPEKPAPEHDGCEGCKWCSKTEKDEPCVNCRGTSYRGVDEKPDLWEAEK